MTLASALEETRSRSRLTAHQPLVTVGCAGANVQNRAAVPADSPADVVVTPTFQNNTAEAHSIAYVIEVGPLSFGPFRVNVPAGVEEQPVEPAPQPTPEEEFGTIEEEEDDTEDTEDTDSGGGGGGVQIVSAPVEARQINDRREVTIQPGDLSPGTYEVAIQQRFGRQQRALCGSIRVAEPEEPEEPTVPEDPREISCATPASATVERDNATEITTRVRLRNRHPRDSQAFIYEVAVGGQVLGTHRVTVPGGQSQVDRRTHEVPASLTGATGQLPVRIRPMFGGLSPFECGSITVEPPPAPEPEFPPDEPEEPDEPTEPTPTPEFGGEIPPTAILAAAILVLVALFAS